jgi:hypothetical protein
MKALGDLFRRKRPEAVDENQERPLPPRWRDPPPPPERAPLFRLKTS